MPRIQRHRPFQATVGDGYITRRQVDSFDAPGAPEYRPPHLAEADARVPKTREEWDAAIDEMRRNDPELRAWRDAERRGELASGR